MQRNDLRNIGYTGLAAISLVVYCRHLCEPFILIRTFLFLALMLGMLLRQGPGKLSLHLLTFSILLLAGYELLTLFWGTSQSNTIKYSQLTLLSFLGLLLLFRNKLQENLRILIILNVLLIGLNMVKAGTDIIQNGWLPYEIHGFCLNKNLLSGLFMLFLPVGIIAWRRASDRRWKWALVCMIILALMFMVVLQSRAVYLSMFVGFLMASGGILIRMLTGKTNFKLTDVKPVILIILPVLAGTVGYLAIVDKEVKEDFLDKVNIVHYISPPQAGEITTVTADNYESIASRKIFWNGSWKIVREHPLKGCGKGDWGIAIGQYATKYLPDRIGRNKSFSHAHNDFVQQVAETGISGLVLFIIPLLLLLTLAFASWFRGTADPDMLILATGLAAFLVFAFFDFPFQQVEHRVLFYGQVLILYQMLEVRYHILSRSLFRINRNLIIAFTVLFCGVSMVQIRSDYHACKAIRQLDTHQVDPAIRNLKKADNPLYRITPNNFPVSYLMGKAYMEKGAYRDAESCFDVALKINPYEIRLLNDFGVIMNLKGEEKLAEQAFKKASLLAPYFEDPLFNLAAIYFFHGAYEKALTELDKLPDSKKKQDYQIQIKARMNQTNQ